MDEKERSLRIAVAVSRAAADEAWAAQKDLRAAQRKALDDLRAFEEELGITDY